MTTLLENPTLTTPIDFSTEVDSTTVRMLPEKVQALADLFEQQRAEGKHPGAQLVVLRHGKVVLDRVSGVAHRLRQVPVKHDTLFLLFSITKMMTAICVHHLIEAGKVEWDAPVATYWPEFGCKGKETATIRDVFLHRAGIPGVGRHIYRQVLYWPNWERVTHDVAESPAEYPPGSKTTYHLMNYGFIFGEVVRRVSGKPIEIYLRDHFLRPLGMDNTFLGLSINERLRIARLYIDREKSEVKTYVGDATHQYAGVVFNMWRIRRAVLPGANAHSTARNIAVFLQMLLNHGTYGGKRLLEPGTVEAATTLGYQGYDHVSEMNMRWAHGFTLGGRGVDWETPGKYGGTGKGSSIRTFGGFGLATSMAWADPDADLVVVFLCNKMLPDEINQHRWSSLSNATWDALIDTRKIA